MKNRIYSLFILLASSYSFSGCNDLVLDLTPQSVLTEADFYKTAQDLDGAVLGIYSSYQARKPRDWAVLEMPTDNIHRTGYFNIGGLDELNNLAFSPENPLFASFWENSYNGIFRANAALSYLDNPTDYAPGKKDQLEGEAKFMRALFYFDLVRMFGGVPKAITLLSIDEAKNTPRASQEEIYSLIIADLNDALAKLPEPSQQATGRAHKAAASALLAKVYVYLEDWTSAKQALDRIEAYGYRLVDDFAQLWSLSNEDNEETIFAIKYTENTNGHVLSTDFLPYFGVTGISTRGSENVFPSWSLQKKYKENDSRKEVTITEYWKSPGSPAAEPAIWYPYVSKFAVPHPPNSSGLDIPVMRYADMLLLQAEVQYRLNQPEAALAALNQVRERAFGSTSENYSLNDIATAESFMDKLVDERQIELALENERWFDLVRTDRFITELKQVERYYNITDQEAQVVALNPQPHHRLFPIPQHQMELAPGVLVQNEGY
jgi:hypothetical protein